MTSLRKSLDSDFEKQRKSLLDALNEQLARSLNQADKKSVDSPGKLTQDFRTELDDFRKYLDHEMKRQMSENIAELKDELTMTFKEQVSLMFPMHSGSKSCIRFDFLFLQEKEMLKLMFKAKTGNDAPAGTNRTRPFQSDFAKELEGIEDDLKQLRTMVVGGEEKSPNKTTLFSASTVDSDTSEDFIEVSRSNKRRPRHHHHRSRQHHGSAYNLNSDADSMYDSSSGGNC
jgi:hypothetical protein